MDDEGVKKALEFATKTTEHIYATRPELRRHELLQRTMAANLSIFNRVYIGSVHFEVLASEVSLLLSVFGPVKSVQMIADQAIVASGSIQHKGYGFVDFEVPEAAELACKADGMEVAHRPVKIGRPANFPTDLPPGVPRPPTNRIYMGNVSSSLSEDIIESWLTTSIGPVKACRLSPDTTTTKSSAHQGFGYVEFERVADAVSAIQLLNGFEIAGRRLAVSKTVVGGPLIEGMKSVVKQAQTSQFASVVVIRNVVDAREIEKETQRTEFLADFLSECVKFGSIKDHQLIVMNDNTVNLYLNFESEQAVKEAIQGLNGRWFGGRQLVVQQYDCDRYLMRDFH